MTERIKRAIILKDKPALDAELIVSDASQYNKVSKTTGTNPEDSWKEYKTRTCFYCNTFANISLI